MPSMPIAEEKRDAWVNHVHNRLRLELLHHVRGDKRLQEFMCVGKVPGKLKPCVVVTCGDVNTKKQVEKLYRNLRWLRELLKSKEICFIAIFQDVNLSAERALGVDDDHGAGSNLSLRIPESAETFCGQTLDLCWGAQRSGCTFGGIMRIGNVPYCLTAAHQFRTIENEPAFDLLPPESYGKKQHR
jgi:hypothetical protein